MEEMASSIEALKKYIKEKLEEQCIPSKLDDFLKSGKSSAGKKSKRGNLYQRIFVSFSVRLLSSQIGV